MATDQEIRDRGFLYIPKQEYLQNPYNLPIAPVPPAAPASGGITNTNAFTNSGGDDFSSTGNAFGYGSPVNEVNVRTFNPQKLDGPQMPSELGFSNNTVPLGNNNISVSQLGIGIPGGQVQNTYTRARNAMGIRGDDTMSKDYPQFTAEQVAKFANNSISDYRQNYQANYNSPYDDTVDLGYKGRDTSTSLEGRIGKDGIRRRSSLGKIMSMFPSVTNVVKKGTQLLQDKFPNSNGPGGGSYGIAGLSDARKEQYNALAKGNMLFGGEQGFKTLTGKNFTGKGYMEGQMDLAKGFGFDTMTEEEIEDELAKTKANPKQQFKYKQMLESSKMYQTTQKQKEKQKEEFNKPGGTGEQVANIQARVDRQYQDQMTRDGRDFSVSGPDTSSNPTGKSNQASSERGYQMHGADGGRAGYFFGGRVNFKNGGLASIL